MDGAQAPRLGDLMPSLSTKADDIAVALEDEIVSGAIAPGSVLRQEQLSERFQVSRTPIREALNRLEALGLVSLEPNRSVRVRTLSRGELREAFLVRAELEGLAAELAAPRMTDGDLPTFLRRDAAIRVEFLATGGRAGAGRPADRRGRDHRAGRPQDGDQRPQLGREGVHGRLRGRELADLGEHDRRPGNLATRSPHDPTSPARQESTG
jgi:DNA-binding transcriptional regulator YhcF (GntR family)